MGQPIIFVCKVFLSRLSLQPHSRKGLEVILADSSYVKTSNVCDIPICFGPGLCYIVSCHVVDELSSKLVLGIVWLTSVNPTLLWFDYEVDLAFDNSVVMLYR